MVNLAAGVSGLTAIRLLILNSCRLSEIQTLKWDYLQGDSFWLPDSETGASASGPGV